jgi:2-dehydro-3-deoxyphosphogluconate aldolase/(4S)-4-hydroxy-2-oxoglutarate aldolase
VKLFPAGSLGPDYVKAVRAPLSHIPFLAVGGVSVKNAADFMRAGCVGVGVGGNLTNKEWIASAAWDKIADAARELVKNVNV